jgi:hypothetical protein
MVFMGDFRYSRGMDKDIYEDILGPDAPTIFARTLERQKGLLSPSEAEAISAYVGAPDRVSESHKAALAGLLTDIADDFTSRRRAAMLKSQLEAPAGRRDEDEEEEGDGWIPDEDGKSRYKDDGDGLEAFLDELD